MLSLGSSAESCNPMVVRGEAPTSHYSTVSTVDECKKFFTKDKIFVSETKMIHGTFFIFEFLPKKTNIESGNTKTRTESVHVRVRSTTAKTCFSKVPKGVI